MNQKVLKHIDYIVSLAGEEDCKLTTIRVVKFLYLMDLLYVKHTGKRLTTWNWRFWDFGPYCEESLDAIKQAVSKNLITSTSHPSKFDEERNYDLISYPKDRILYKNDLEKHITQLAKNLSIPTMIQLEMKSYIKKYGNDTSGLLDYVYFQTEPMQKAKPRESLDFSTVSQDDPSSLQPTRLSKEKIKKAKEAIQRMKQKMLEERERFQESIKSERLSSDYIKGMDILNQLEEEEEINDSGSASIASLKG